MGHSTHNRVCTRCHKFFHINNWLAANGWLAFKRNPVSLLKRAAFRLGVTPINALKWLTAVGLSDMRKNVKRGRGGGALRRFFLSFNDVDWTRTKAFSNSPARCRRHPRTK